MKKLIGFLLVFICLLALVGCNSRKYEDKPQVVGSIKEIHDDYIIIATSTTDGPPYGASFDISVNIKDCNNIYSPLSIGDEIVVYYDGHIPNDDLPQIDTIYAITLKAPATN